MERSVNVIPIAQLIDATNAKINPNNTSLFDELWDVGVLFFDWEYAIKRTPPLMITADVMFQGLKVPSNANTSINIVKNGYVSETARAFAGPK
jgi:hypothetical protein